MAPPLFGREGFIISKAKFYGRMMAIGSLYLSSITFAQDVPEIEFKIKPNLCILAQGEALCRDQLSLIWKSVLPQSLCLYQNKNKKPLTCWQDETFGEFLMDIATSKNMTFYLKQEQHQLRIAQQELQVIQNKTKYRHRRRNAWSFY